MTEIPDSLLSNQPTPIDENASGPMGDSNEEALVGRSMIAATSKLMIIADSIKYEQRVSFKESDPGRVNNLIGDITTEPALNETLIVKYCNESRACISSNI